MPQIDDRFDTYGGFLSLIRKVIRDVVSRLISLSPFGRKRNKEMDPATFIAGVAAVMQAIQTWVAVRDSRAAANRFSSTMRAEQTNPQVVREGEILESLIPGAVLDKMIERVNTCWKRYERVLNDEEYLPSEIDDATEAVKRCICRELSRIYDLNGDVPEGKLQQYWIQYCATA